MLKFLPALCTLLLVTASSFGQPSIKNIWNTRDTIGIYDKFEARILIEATFENPFDPEDIDLQATFTSPGGKTWTLPGFYTTSGWAGWMIRFSPNETGIWNYKVSVKDRKGKAESTPGQFTTIKSNYKGPLKISPNKRFLQHADGAPYYGVGLWYNGVVQAEVLDELKALGVNYISNFITPIETWASGVGRYDQLICDRIDNMLGLLEERDMQLSLNIWFHSFLSETVWGGGNVRWYANPYATVTDAKNFYSSEEAWKYQEKMYRYMIARWSYSRSLAIWFVVDEVNGTDGWVSGDSLGAANWGKKIHEYFKQNDPWQHLTTGTRSGGINEWWQEGYEIFDMPGREIYEAQGFPIITDGNIKSSEIHPLTSSYRNYAGQVQKLWNGFNKPVLIPETGWDHTFYEMTMPGYQAQFHNAIWVSLACGAAMSPFWWSYSRALNDNVVTNQLLSLRKFTDQIPFSKLTNVSSQKIVNSDGDAYAIGSDQLIYGWVVNTQTDLYGKKITLPDLQNGTYKLRLYHPWRGSFIEDTAREVEVKDGILTFSMPEMQIKESHAYYIGQDIAFILEKPMGKNTKK
ncbi:MAG: DUF5060 domain-containing protein [Cyclobacteriaceae bacterium]|nr:DUF5060 domain-containing protein [Cyclobacteriaceae bacterium]